jgi:molybdopterin synthase sulfur carrier subunit
VPTIRYWAAARAAAGVPEERYDGLATLADLVAAAVAAHSGDGLPKVLARCSWVVDEAPVGGRAHDAVELRPDSVVEALPPFAGGCDDEPCPLT